MPKTVSPVLVTTIVKITLSPTITVLLTVNFSTVMSGLITLVSLLEVLFSVKLEDALTVFMIVPFTLAVNQTVKLALSPAAKTPL